MDPLASCFTFHDISPWTFCSSWCCSSVFVVCPQCSTLLFLFLVSPSLSDSISFCIHVYFSDSLLLPSFCFSRYQLCKYGLLFVSNMPASLSRHLAPLILETCACVLLPFVWLVTCNLWIWDTRCWLLLDWAKISKTYLYIKAVCTQTSAPCLPHWPILCFVWGGKQKNISVSWGFIVIFWAFFHLATPASSFLLKLGSFS